MHCDGILFDLDGTLWDATSVIAEGWKAVLSRHPEIHTEITQETVKKYMGLTNEELAAILFPALSFSESFALMMESCAEENRILRSQGGTLYPHVSKILYTLSERFPLFIISNCQSGYIAAFLEYHNFADAVKDHLCSGDTGMPKAENIRLICQKYALHAPVYIGDTQGDYAASHAAGCAFIHAAYGFGQIQAEKCSAVVYSPIELLKFF